MKKHVTTAPAILSPDAAGGSKPRSLVEGDIPSARYSEKAIRERARLDILALWPDWARQNLNGRSAKDNDAHAFLRFVRQTRPELFHFKGGLSPYEAAFFWILGAGLVAY